MQRCLKEGPYHEAKFIPERGDSMTTTYHVSANLFLSRAQDDIKQTRQLRARRVSIAGNRAAIQLDDGRNLQSERYFLTNTWADDNSLCLSSTSRLQVHQRMARHLQTSSIPTTRPHHRLRTRPSLRGQRKGPPKTTPGHRVPHLARPLRPQHLARPRPPLQARCVFARRRWRWMYVSHFLPHPHYMLPQSYLSSTSSADLRFAVHSPKTLARHHPKLR
jgi:hypothetical protein